MDQFPDDPHDSHDSLRLAELLAVRLCHDLSSPLGTLMGALELAGEDPDAATEALALAGDVSTTLVKRLRLLRAAWGGAIPALEVAELQTMAEGLERGRKLRIDFTALHPAGHFSSAASRLILNVLMLAAESLPLGGVIALAGDPVGDVMVTITGPRAAWPPGFAGFLADQSLAWRALRVAEDIDASRGLQPLLTALLARAAGSRLSLLMGPSAEAAPPLLIRFA